MIKTIKIFAAYSAIFLLLLSCDPAKNTFVNRTYHSTTAQYNGYFNANVLLDEALTAYRTDYKENYYERLPLEVFPTEADVQNMYPAIDTAIAKCTKVIQEHSMPGSAKPSKKREENNTFIDENWITIGIAYFYRRDYDAAMKNFKFVRKFYQNDPSNYVGELWMAKTNIATKKYTEASFNLDKIQAAVDREDELKKRSINERIEDFKKRDDKETKPAKLPKSIRFDYELTCADLALVKGDKEKAVKHLLASLDHTWKKSKKARVYYILGQLAESEGKTFQAQSYYNKVLRSNAPFSMAFSARLKRAFLGGDEKLVKELRKMLRDEKNAEYKDQIYYALAQIEKKKGNEPGVFENLTSSAFYSTSNARQKAMAYEEMGDIRFSQKNYIPAQKYYDSCAQSMPEDYPNGEAIQSKAAKLSDLVVAVERAAFEDSVQRIAAMDEDTRIDFIEDVIKQIKAEEKERKRKEAEKLAALQKNVNFNQTGGGGKWYWTNAKARAEGKDEFERQWGKRENENDWRRSDKIVVASFTDPNDSTATDQPVDNGPVPVDSLTVDMLMKDIPMDDSSLQASKYMLAKSLYDAGVIYKDQLKEEKQAANAFNEVVNNPFESEFRLLSAFELYKLFEKTKPSIAGVHKQFIIGNYPDSDYANFLKDPDYFVKQKELEAETEKSYVKTLDRYDAGKYYATLLDCDKALKSGEITSLTPKYLLLKVMSQGQLGTEQALMKPSLNRIVEEFGDTPEAARAQELLDIMKNGVSKNEAVDFSNKSPFTYDDNKDHYVLVFLPKEESSSLAKSKISDFSREYFSRDNLKVKSKIYGTDQSVVLIEDFAGDSKAKEYVRVYKSTRKHLLDLQNAKILAITKDNLKVLFQTQNLDEYEIFYEENY